MNHRLDRVNEVIKRELAEIFTRQFTFDGALLTVQQVDITPDLRNAHVWVSLIGSKNIRGTVLEKLEQHRLELQRELAKRVVLKYTPHLHFKIDDSIARGVRVNQILNELDIPPTPEDLEYPDETDDERK